MKTKLNPNEDRVRQIREALKANGGYCPCRIDQTPDTKCPCKEFREQKMPGECHCGLYVKE